jgi:succinate dehydrogenase / fumarate reductase cytochrome b subunit
MKRIFGFIGDFFLNLRWSTIAFYGMRVTGLALAFFLLLHLFSVGQIAWSEKAFDKTMGAYDTKLFHFGEYFVLLAVLFHVANGMRVMIGDFFAVTKTQRAILLVTMLAAFAIAVFAAFRFLKIDDFKW